ncbi:TonB-dependent receptor domain-containing protein [Paremcibacter congregatus]
MMLALNPTAVSAQDADAAAADETVLEEVVVTGIRGSLLSSIAKKRNNSSIVEAVSAEDIGKLPDASIAESIARLPGLAAQRLDGRANVISIRGLAPDFTTTTLNGREQVSANNNRAVEFDQFPSELINAVVVHKTTDAKLVSQAVGGTVDLQTVRPLAHGKQTIVVNMRGEYNDLGALNSGTTAWGYRASASYIDQFADDTIGIALGYARMVSPTQEERWNAWGYPTLGNRSDAVLDDDGVVITPAVPYYDAGGNAIPTETEIIGGAKPYVKSNELTRDGLMGVLEFEPNDSFNTTVDMYYSKFHDEQILRGIEIPLKWSGASLRDGAVVDNGLITSGTWDNVEGVVRNDVVNKEAETFSAGINSHYEIDDSWSVEADLSYSKVTRTESNMETYSGTGRGSGVGAVDTLGFSQTDDGAAIFSPGLDYSNPSLIQLGGPLSWGGGLVGAGIFDTDRGQDGFINRPSSDDELKSIRLSGTRIIEDSFIDSLEFGARYADRSKSLLDEGVYLTLKGFVADPDNFGTLPVPEEFLLAPTSLAFIGMGNMLSYDAQALFDSGAYQESQGFAARVNSAGQVVREIVIDGDKYWNFLPSMNLSLEVADDQKVRLGVARVLARPRMDQMNSGFSFGYNDTLKDSTNINNSPWSGGGGNPKLRPFMTWQFDATYEAYFGEGGYVAIAGFYKKIESFPFDQSTPFDFASIVDISGIEDVIFTQGLVTQPQNVHGGKIYGVEISGSLPFDILTESLDGFGMTFSASFTDSDVKETPTSDSLDMPGLSNTVINSTVYYEKYGFQARASMRYRSDFLGEVSGLSLVRESKFIKAETIFDAQISYDLSEVGVEGLSVLVQANNLTNQKFTSYQGDDKRQVRDFQNYGRTFLFGLNYKM